MKKLKEPYFMLSPIAEKDSIVCGKNYRFTVLTPCLIRMEYSPCGIFEDRATNMVFCRNLKRCSFKVKETETSLEIITDSLHVYYDKKPFSSEGLSVRLIDEKLHKCARWHYKMDKFYWQKTPYNNIEDNMFGTARTLDGKDGEIPLDESVVTKAGFYALEDKGPLVYEDGVFVQRNMGENTDIYFFGYGRNIKECVRDFCTLCGGIPMIPRYALGNWWSRYYAYSDKSYNELLDKFKEENIPLSVAVLDMNWHICDADIPKGQGGGWGTYTWDKNYFPNPRKFLKSVHDRGLAVTGNIHPHDGVRYFEDKYEKFAKDLGKDPAKKEQLYFDVADDKYMSSFMKDIIGELEKDGFDFFWIDWQQEDKFKDGYDPLFMLNHYFYKKSCEKGKYGMTMSRYSGLGSNRYPIGFSGDSRITWETLEFQPYFTANAANAGYFWWSHDIGGHANGIWDRELQIRWTQLGVFSPIMRFHSGNCVVYNKEPWSYPEPYRTITGKFLRLRCALIPYLYTMNYRAFKEHRAICEPMYYEYPQHRHLAPAHYEFRNQYMFGTSFMVCPIVSKSDGVTHMGKVKVCLPEGLWFDFLTNRVYTGNRLISAYRTAENYPVFVKAGSIIPLTDESCIANGCENPEKLEVRVFAGSDGNFTLYEDDGCLENNNAVFTVFDFKWSKKGKSCLFKYDNTRQCNVVLVGFENARNFELNGKSVDFSEHDGVYKVKMNGGSLSFVCDGVQANNKKQWIEEFVMNLEYYNVIRTRLFSCHDLSEVIANTDNMDIVGAMTEIYTADNNLKENY